MNIYNIVQIVVYTAIIYTYGYYLYVYFFC
jgi:hypothetical protein